MKTGDMNQMHIKAIQAQMQELVPNASEAELGALLWCATPFPAGTGKQIIESFKRTVKTYGANYNDIIKGVHDEMEYYK